MRTRAIDHDGGATKHRSSRLALALCTVTLAICVLVIGTRMIAWSEIGDYVETRATVVSARAAGQGGIEDHRLVVVYTYEVDGRAYRGSNQDTARHNLSQSEANKALAKYAPGTAITVFVDPNEPSQSVLSRDEEMARLIGQAFFPMLLLMGFMLAPAARTMRAHRRRQSLAHPGHLPPPNQARRDSARRHHSQQEPAVATSADVRGG